MYSETLIVIQNRLLFSICFDGAAAEMLWDPS